MQCSVQCRMLTGDGSHPKSLIWLEWRKHEHPAWLKRIKNKTKLDNNTVCSKFTCACVLHRTCMISYWLRETVCWKLLFSEKLTVLLVVALVPSAVLRGAEDLSWLGHSLLSGLWRTWSYKVWFNVDFETAPHCNNITTAIKTVGLSLAEQARTGWSQRWPGEKKTRGRGQLLGKWKLHSQFCLTEVHKGACMCGSSFERTKIMTLSNIPVKMSCLAQSPVIS